MLLLLIIDSTTNIVWVIAFKMMQASMKGRMCDTMKPKVIAIVCVISQDQIEN